MELPGFATPTQDGLVVRLRVTPRARQAAIGGMVLDAGGTALLKVAVTAVAEDGKANAAVETLLAASWRVPRASLSLRQGLTARNKTLHLTGDPAELQGRLSRWWEAHARRHAD